MIYSLYGNVIENNPPYIIIDTGSISFELLYASNAFHTEKEARRVFVFEEFNEDNHYLVGFDSLKEKELFLNLLSIKGIGIKTAVNLLRGAPLESLIKFIETKNYIELVKIPGIGKFSAGLIISAIPEIIAKNSKDELTKEKLEAKSALKELGYKDKDFMMYLINAQSKTSVDLVTEVLQKIGRNMIWK